MLDLEATSLDQIADLILENMVNSNQLSLDIRDSVKENLLRRHRHQHEKKHDKGHERSRLPNIRSLVDIGRTSSKSMFASHSKCRLILVLWQMPSSSSSSSCALVFSLGGAE